MNCTCSWLNKVLMGCYCDTTDVCEKCEINEGRVVGYGGHSDLPFYECYECTPPEKPTPKGKTLQEQLRGEE